MVMKSFMSWNVTPCSPLKTNWRFAGTYRINLQCRRIIYVRIHHGLTQWFWICFCSWRTSEFYSLLWPNPSDCLIIINVIFIINMYFISCTFICNLYCLFMPMTVYARSKAWTVFAPSNTGIVGSNPTKGMDGSVRLCCVYVGSDLATGWSSVQGALPTVYGLRNWKSGQNPQGL
jgi:hypothetical protein